MITLLLFVVGVVLAVLLEFGANRKPSGSLALDDSQLLPSVPTFARRIVCMTPSVTESVFALGGGERVVGVTDFCDYPPQAAQKEKLGGFFNPNFERLLSIKPDLIISQGKSEKITRFCQKENIPLLYVQMSDIDVIFNDLTLLGQILGCPEQAQKLCDDIRQTFNQIKTALADQPRPRVFLSLYRSTGFLNGLTTAGGQTFLSELISCAGAENIFDDLARSYPQISYESLLKRQPQIIIETFPGLELSDDRKRQMLQDWQTLGALPAVKNDRIYFVPESTLLKPGPRIGQAAAYLAQLIHPEVFGER